MLVKIKKAINVVRKQGIRKTTNIVIEKRKQQKKELNIIQNYHLISKEDMENQKEVTFEKTPKISIITPLYNTPKEYLVQMIESVKNQTYEYWELCLADGSDEQHKYVQKICEEYSKQDDRIVYKKLVENKGIVGNTNQCLKLSTGEYIGLLDHDDILHVSALYEIVRVIQEDADFIYTDEMKFKNSIQNSRDIVCKNGFGKDELRAHNYICHFVTFNRVLLENMDELYREQCEGSQDYDMVLRLTEKAKKIVHIPKILYYWRVHEGSVSMDLSVKQYAVDAAKTAIASQLERSGEKGKVECNFPYQTIYKTTYEIIKNPKIAIVLWGMTNESQIEKTVKQLIKQTNYRPLEIISDQKKEIKFDDQQIRYVNVDKNRNRYKWFNEVVELTTSEYYIFLHAECLPMNEEWIEELLMFAQRKDVGAVGAELLYQENKVFFAGGVLDKNEKSGIHCINYNMNIEEQGYEANMKHVRNTTILSSMCMMISRKKLLQLNGFDENLGDCGDADFCLRVEKQGDLCVWNVFSKLNYQGNWDLQKNWEKCNTFKEKWKDNFNQADQYYHPLLKKLKKM